jgi:hypothetical protein
MKNIDYRSKVFIIYYVDFFKIKSQTTKQLDKFAKKVSVKTTTKNEKLGFVARTFFGFVLFYFCFVFVHFYHAAEI